MFEWYRNAELCIAYLVDVDAIDDNNNNSFEQSDWFKRGWTLQELLAPRVVVFLTKTWHVIGHKGNPIDSDCGITTSAGPNLERIIAKITGIPEQVVHDYETSHSLPIEEKLKWMDNRQTSREEDTSYALYGIFDVALGANYGEKRDRARQRLLGALSQRQNVAEQRRDRFKKISNWLAPADPETTHVLARRRHEPHTGAWFLQSDEYQNWKAGTLKCLWIYGKAGCGKTVLCSTAIQDIRSHCEGAKNAAHACFYFTFSDNEKQSCENLLRSFVVQLGWKEPGLL